MCGSAPDTDGNKVWEGWERQPAEALRKVLQTVTVAVLHCPYACPSGAREDPTYRV